MSALSFPEDEWAIKRMIAEDPPESIRKLALWQAEDIIDKLVTHRDLPGRYSDAAVFKRADRESDADIASELSLGATYSPEDLARYRDLYRLAFLDAWRNPATLAAIRERRARGGVIFVCVR